MYLQSKLHQKQEAQSPSSQKINKINNRKLTDTIFGIWNSKSAKCQVIN